MAQLHVDQWNIDEGILDWSKTKNGKPHSLPVPDLAPELLESIKPNEHGWFFPSAMAPTRPVSAGTLYAFMWRQRGRSVIPVVTNRDLRRTWKTLAGKTGVSMEIRDRLQDHTLQDVSSKHYDRWQYMPEKREGMKKRNAVAVATRDQARHQRMCSSDRPIDPSSRHRDNWTTFTEVGRWKAELRSPPDHRR